MDSINITKRDDILLRLSHYFITHENYTPIVVNGVNDEVWLSNENAPYRIIRISTHYVHNNEQFDFELFKIKNIMKQIKRKTLSFKMNALNIELNLGDDVVLKDEKNINSVYINSISAIKKKKVLTETFPAIKDNLMEDLKGMDLIIKSTDDINHKSEKENKVYDDIFKPKKEIITNFLIAANIIVFILLYVFGHGSTDNETLFKFGANYSEAVKNGEYYRLITSVFLHAGFIHLLVNMYSLKIIGGQIETYLGKWRYLVVFLLSGISGSLLSCIFSNSLSVGASGAIFGLLGSFIYFGYHHRVFFNTVLKNQVIPIVLINLLIGFMIPGIDNACHIGGLIGGYLATKMVGLKGKTNVSDQIQGIILCLLYFGMLVYFLFFR